MKKFIAALVVAVGVTIVPAIGMAQAAQPQHVVGQEDGHDMGDAGDPGDTPAPAVEIDADEVSTIVLAAPIVTIVVSLLIPVVNGLLTKASTPSKVKAIGTIVANAVMAVIATGLLTDGTAVLSATTLYTAGIGAAISILGYLGLYQPMGITSSNKLDKVSGQVVQGRLADKGVK